MRPHPRGSAVPAAVLLLFGCGGEAPPAAGGVVITDSAGVRIVRSEGPVWTSETAWRLSDEPAVVIGVIDGAPGDQLFDVVDAARLPDGRILVGNRGSSELKIYDARGGHLRTFGRDGEGPGEFRMLSSVHADGDSVFVWDQRDQRLSVFSAESGFVRSLSLTPAGEGSLPRFDARFADGTILSRQQTFVSSEIEDASVQGSAATYMRYSAAGAPMDTIGTFRGSRSLLKFFDSGGGLSVLTIPYEPATRITAAGNAVYEGDGEDYEIRRYRADGTLDRIVRRPFASRPVTSAMMRAHFDEEYGRFEDQPDYFDSVREGYEAMPLAERLAAFDRLHVGADGVVWTRNYPLPGETTHTWSVFDPEGVWLGEVGVPAMVTVYEVGPGFVLGRQLDELDVERVVVFEVLEP